MPTDFATRTYNFPKIAGSVQTRSETFTFNSNIVPGKAKACVAGFDVSYSGEDHHLGQLQIRVTSLTVTGPSVTVEVTYVLRDVSGNIDDDYQGDVDMLVIVDRV
jgi:hypothetical protein